MVATVKELYGKEVDGLFKDVRNAELVRPINLDSRKEALSRAEFEKAVDKFVDKYGGHKYFVGFVGSATQGAIIEDLKREKRVVDIYLALTPVQLAINLNERNKKLEREIVKLEGTVDRKSGEEITGMKFYKFLDEVLSEDPTKFNSAMERIGKGGLDSTSIENLMKRMISTYERGGSETKEGPKLEERIRTVNTVLAGEYRDLNYQLSCEKNRAAFRDLKAV